MRKGGASLLYNSDFICLLKQAPGDRDILAQKLNISPLQLSYVDNSKEGNGLLIYKGIIIPFEDPWPKSSPLYAVMTTKLEEALN
jgi:hypothetical protein